MEHEKIDLIRLIPEAEMLLDFVQSNPDRFSKNPLQIPVIPTDVHLLVKFLVNDKYGYDYHSQPNYDENIGAFDKFITTVPDQSEKNIEKYSFKYFDSETLKGVTPEFSLLNFKKGLSGEESRFSNIIKYAENALSDRQVIAQALTHFDNSVGLDFKNIYSPAIEEQFISRAMATHCEILESTAPRIKQEHSDIQINLDEYQDLKFKDKKVETDDKTTALFLKAGQMLIDTIERNDSVGKSIWQDPVFTLKAFNSKTGYQYGTENKVLLNDAVSTKGFETGLFMSYNEARSIPGLNVARGQEGTQIIQRYGKKVAAVTKTLEDGSKVPLLDDNGDEVFIYKRAARTVTVFNIDQLEFKGDGVDPRIKMKEDYNKPAKVTASNQYELDLFNNSLMKAIDVPVKQGGHTNFYNPALNFISLADKSLFVNDLQYAQTAMHEWLHSSGHQDKLKRESLYKYHTNDFYRGFEETLVNVAAVKLAQHYGLDASELNNSFHANEDAYNVGWAKQVFKKDPMQIIESMYQADEAFRYAKTRLDAQLKADNVLDVFIDPKTAFKEPAKIGYISDKLPKEVEQIRKTKMKVTV